VSNLFDLHREFLADRRPTVLASPDEIAGLHTDTDVPAEIADWLKNLKQLVGVPLDYLVPDEAMLPAESLRFFQVDENWRYCLVEGAFSVARTTSGDASHDHATAASIHTAADENPSSVDATPEPQATGFLLRSGVVSGWPGLRVVCKDKNGVPLTACRSECVAPDILLCLASGVIASVVFQSPPETLHFGIPKGDNGEMSKEVPLRDVTSGVTTGKIEIVQRDNTRVLKVHATALGIQSALNLSKGHITAAEFALQMLEGVSTATFTTEAVQG
jgi:hypothetical protein